MPHHHVTRQPNRLKFRTYSMQLFVNPALSNTLKTRLRQGLPADIQAVFRHDLPEVDQHAVFQQSDFVLGNPPVAWFTDETPRLAFWQLDSAGFDGFSTLR